MTVAWCVLALALTAADNQTPAKADEAVEIWPMRLREAVQLGINNCPSIRVTFVREWRHPIGCFDAPAIAESEPPRAPEGAYGASIVVEPVDDSARVPRVKSDLTVSIRAVEREYWHLAEAHVALWAADMAVSRARGLIEIEQELGNPDCPENLDELAATMRRLKQFEKKLVDRTADVIAAQRQFRTVVGLPESDNQRIVPVTPPIEARLVFVWGTLLDSVPANSQVLVKITRVCRLPKENLVAALDSFDEEFPKQPSCQEDEISLGRWFFDRPSIPLRGCVLSGGVSMEGILSIRREFQDSPPRFDRAAHYANSTYDRYATTRRLRIAAQARIETARTCWDKGRITADRCLDAVEEYAALVTDEQHHLSTYNSALTAVSECQETLLQEHFVIVQTPAGRETTSTSAGQKKQDRDQVNSMEEILK